MERNNRATATPGPPPRRARRRPAASRSTLLATPLALAYVSVAVMMVVRVILVWNALYSTPSFLGTVVDHLEKGEQHWLVVRWKERDLVRDDLERVSASDYAHVQLGAPVEIVPTTPTLYLYPGHSRSARVWPLAGMALFWIAAGGFVIYHVALPALRQRWLVRYGAAVAGEVVEVREAKGVATVSYRYTPASGPAQTGQMLIAASAATHLRTSQHVTVLHARNPRSSVVYEATDFEVL